MKRASILFSVLIAIVWLFASSEAVANGGWVDPCQPEGSTVPTCCTFVDSNGNPFRSDGNPGYSGLQVLPDESNQWPVYDETLHKWRWQYQVTYRPVSVFGITTLAPMCYPDITTWAFTWQWPFPILENILSGTIFRLYPDFDKPFIVWFYTDQETPIGRTSFQMNVGYNTYFCRDIQGPVCPGYVPVAIPLNLVPLNTTEYKKLGAYDIRVTRDPATWCVTKMEICTAYNGPTCTTWVEIPPVSVKINDQDLITCTSLDGNQKCQECILYSASSPGCYTYSSGGTTYKVPTGCK